MGDAKMSAEELREAHYNWDAKIYEPSGLNQLEQFRKRYPYTLWLNPRPLPQRQNYWTRTHLFLERLFPMYDLTAEGLEAGIRRLMSK